MKADVVAVYNKEQMRCNTYEVYKKKVRYRGLAPYDQEYPNTTPLVTAVYTDGETGVSKTYTYDICLADKVIIDLITNGYSFESLCAKVKHLLPDTIEPNDFVRFINSKFLILKESGII